MLRQEVQIMPEKIGQRNYQIDVLKLFFTFTVFISHTAAFIGNNTKFVMPTGLGWVSVHFFFIVSGFLMVNTYMKNRPDGSGKNAVSFVIRKFCGISFEYWSALIICTSVYVAVVLSRNGDVGIVLESIIPEIFALGESGMYVQDINGATWYISAMLIAMLPLYYLLCKKPDFFLYVFSPLAAILIMGYMYNTKPFTSRVFNGIFLDTLTRAVCGLCFGVIAWLFCNKIKEFACTKSRRVLLTVMEIVLYVTFLVVWFIPGQEAGPIYSVLLILPFAVAITFSGRSYIAGLFRWKGLKYLGSISLAFYFNHIAAVRIVDVFMPPMSYKMSLLWLVICTAVLCGIYYLMVWLLKKLWNTKVKYIFVDSEITDGHKS